MFYFILFIFIYNLWKKNLREYIQREKDKGNLVRIKRNAQSSESTSPIEADYRKSIYTNNIPQSETDVKQNFSLKPVEFIQQ